MKKYLVSIAALGLCSLAAYAYVGSQEEYQIADDLAAENIIKQSDTIEGYKLTNYVLRQEVIGI